MDTNALMMPVQFDVRLFEEVERLLDGYEPAVPRAVVEELRELSDSGMGEDAMAASVGRDLATERCRVIEHGEPHADDAIVELVREGVADYVVTNDAPLRERVLDAGRPVIGLRSGNKLGVTQP